MLVFRILHLLGGVFLSLILYGPESIAALADHLLTKASEMKNEVDGDFCGEYPPVVCVSIILSLCDVTMVPFMPMRNSAFFVKSKGFSTMPMMQFCLVLKTAQSVVSVVCQIAYLSLSSDDLHRPTTSNQARALFIMSILTAFMGAVMGMILLCLKQKFINEDDTRQQSTTDSMGAGDLDMGDVYRSNAIASDGVEPMDNPMHRTTPDASDGTTPIESTTVQRIADKRREIERLQGTLDERKRDLDETRRDLDERKCELEQLELEQQQREGAGDVEGGGSPTSSSSSDALESDI
jgi:hypothetical protein